MSLIQNVERATERLGEAHRELEAWLLSEAARLKSAVPAIVRAVTDRIMRLARDERANEGEIAVQYATLSLLGLTEEEIKQAVAEAPTRDLRERIRVAKIRTLIGIAEQLVADGFWTKIAPDDFDVLFEENGEIYHERKQKQRGQTFDEEMARQKINQIIGIHFHGERHCYVVADGPLRHVMGTVMYEARQRLRVIGKETKSVEVSPRNNTKVVMREPINNLGDALKAAGYPQRNGTGTTASSEAS